VRFGGPLERVQLDIDPNSISSASEDDASNTVTVTKRKHQTTSKHFIGESMEMTRTRTRLSMSDLKRKPCNCGDLDTPILLNQS
jgi:hypothetical protein